MTSIALWRLRKWHAVQGVIELLGSIHIIQSPSEGRKPTRVGAALTQRLAALREDLEAASATALPGAAPTSTASRLPSDAVLQELEGYIGQRPNVRGLTERQWSPHPCLLHIALSWRNTTEPDTYPTLPSVQ